MVWAEVIHRLPVVVTAAPGLIVGKWKKVQRDLVPKLANEHKAPFTLNEPRFLCEFGGQAGR